MEFSVGSDPWLSSGLHDGQSEPGDPVARRAHGPRDGARIAVRGRGCFLGWTARRQRRRHSRPYRVAAQPGFRRRHRTGPFHHRHGGAAHRRERPRGRGGRRCAGHSARPGHFGCRRNAVLHLRATVAAADGRFAATSSPWAAATPELRSAAAAPSLCCFSTTRFSAARATPPSPCGCSGSRTSSICFSTPA